MPRPEDEIAHGRYLAEAGAEDIWGWSTPAGQLRAARRAELIARGGRLAPGMSALEVGCGTGLFTEKLAASGARIVGVDISEELLQIARKRNLPEDRIQFVAGRFEECELHGPFDAIVGSSVLHHLDYRAAIQRIFDMLVPGGRLSFAEPNMLNPQIAVQKNIPWLKKMLGDTPDETAFVRWQLKKLLMSLGFVDIQITPFDWLHPYTPRPLIPLVKVCGRAVECIPLMREFSGSLAIAASKPG